MIKYFIIALILSHASDVGVLQYENQRLNNKLNERMEEYGTTFNQTRFSKLNIYHYTDNNEIYGRAEIKYFNSTYLYTQQSYEDSLEN